MLRLELLGAPVGGRLTSTVRQRQQLGCERRLRKRLHTAGRVVWHQ